MSKVAVKYQVTIPPRIRTALNIMPGIEVDFQEEKGRFFLVKNPGIDPIEKWCGALKTNRSPDEIIAELRGYGVESIG